MADNPAPIPLSSVLSDVHPDHHADRLPQPVCLRLSGDALRAQSLRHPLPPRAERSQTQAQFQGENADCIFDGDTRAVAILNFAGLLGGQS